MEYRFNTPLNGNIAMTYRYHEDTALQRDKSLYKFVWLTRFAYSFASCRGEKGGG